MDACVISQHESTNFVSCFNIGAFLAQSYLDRRRPPVDKVSQFFLSDPLKGFMNLCCVDFPLNDIEDGHVFSFFGWSTDHDVVGVEQSPHDIQNCCFLYIRGLLFYGEGSVSCHEEMTPWSRN